VWFFFHLIRARSLARWYKNVQKVTFSHSKTRYSFVFFRSSISTKQHARSRRARILIDIISCFLFFIFFLCIFWQRTNQQSRKQRRSARGVFSWCSCRRDCWPCHSYFQTRLTPTLPLSRSQARVNRKSKRTESVGGTAACSRPPAPRTNPTRRSTTQAARSCSSTTK